MSQMCLLFGGSTVLDSKVMIYEICLAVGDCVILMVGASSSISHGSHAQETQESRETVSAPGPPTLW